MIPLSKLAKLAPRHRMRKAALVLEEVERLALAGEGGGNRPDEGELRRWASGLAGLLSEDAATPEPVKAAAGALDKVAGSPGEDLGAPGPSGLVRAVDALRHALLGATGQAPADWDLIDPRTGRPDRGARRVLPGVKVYLDDLRSPFNVGSIFRTSDAFGVEELLLSPACADPLHPRARRSAMGAVELLPWRRSRLEELSGSAPTFALELGGDDLDEFPFPPAGIVVLGSEELGISRETRELCSYGTVSIPMAGAKGSLNVAVAFGILMYAWTRVIKG